MRLRTFTADSIPEALAMVKVELGEDAIILSTQEKNGGAQVTAAIDPDSDTPTPPPSSRQSTPTHHHSMDQLRYDVQHCLRFHNVPELFIAKMSATLNDATIANILGKGRMNIANESRHFLKLALEHIGANYFRFSRLEPAQPGRIMLVGTPGVGKTLAIAKLATSRKLGGDTIAVITTDTHRAGGIEQLKSFTDILGVPLTICGDKKALATALKMAPHETTIFIDTAGCNPYLEEDITRLAGFGELPGVETVLAMSAGMDAQEALDTVEAMAALPVTRLAATRADCSRRFGGLLTVAAAHKLPLCFASDSPSVADNITEFSAKTLAQTLLKP